MFLLRRSILSLSSIFTGMTMGCWYPLERISQLTCDPAPIGAIPAPPGTAVNGYYHAEMRSAEQDDFVIYLHEWYQGGTMLGPYGGYHLKEIAHRLATVPFPVVIQPSGRSDLDRERRQGIVSYLTQMGIADAQARVLLQPARAEGLRGAEAAQLFRRQSGSSALGGSVPSGARVGAGVDGVGLSGTENFGF